MSAHPQEMFWLVIGFSIILLGVGIWTGRIDAEVGDIISKVIIPLVAIFGLLFLLIVAVIGYGYYRRKTETIDDAIIMGQESVGKEDAAVDGATQVVKGDKVEKDGEEESKNEAREATEEAQLEEEEGGEDVAEPKEKSQNLREKSSMMNDSPIVGLGNVNDKKQFEE